MKFYHLVAHLPSLSPRIPIQRLVDTVPASSALVAVIKSDAQQLHGVEMGGKKGEWKPTGDFRAVDETGTRYVYQHAMYAACSKVQIEGMCPDYLGCTIGQEKL